VKSATALTRQLLGFAQGGRYQVKPVQLNTIVRRSARMFGRTKKEIRIVENLLPELRPVEVDSQQIEQVLLNLYVNAWQAMPAGGDLLLKTRNVVLASGDVQPHGLPPGPYVKVSVADTGTGMDFTDSADGSADGISARGSASPTVRRADKKPLHPHYPGSPEVPFCRRIS
jgi:signal transduction histidine kinase